MKKTTLLARFLMPIFTIVFLYFVFNLSIFSRVENSLQDAVTRAVSYSLPFSKDIIILEVDNDSIVSIGQWPWPRKVWSEVFDKLNLSEPKVIGLDILFSEKSNLGKDDDEALATTLKNSNLNFVFPIETISEIESLKPLDIFLINKNISLGYIDISLDSRDSVVRSVPTDKYLFAEAIYDNLNKKNTNLELKNTSTQEIILTKKNIENKNEYLGLAIKEKEELSKQINYTRGAGLIRKVSVSDFLSKDYDVKLLENKIILIGATAVNLHDEARTPMTTDRLMSGVEIHANILNQYINDIHIYKINSKQIILLGLTLLCIVISFSFIKNITLRSLASTLTLIVLVSIVCKLRLSGYILPILWPVFSIILSVIAFIFFEYNQDKKSKRQIVNLFGKYVSKNVLTKLLENPESVILGGEKKLVTVLFSDIRGFTTLSEKLDPEKVVNFLNEYFEAMSKCVIDTGGVLDKYIGDAIMAFWGAPIDDSKHADNAILAAQNMIKNLKPLQEKYKLMGIDLDIGIGLHTGYAVVGNIGSSHRFDYTVIGDTVNTSSRLEGLNKDYKTNIIASQEVKNMSQNKNLTWLPLGSAKVKGREQGIVLYTLG